MTDAGLNRLARFTKMTRVPLMLRTPWAGLVLNSRPMFQVVWGLGRHEDFLTAAEADARADELHKEMVETWPLLAGTNDASLPRVVLMSRERRRR